MLILNRQKFYFHNVYTTFTLFYYIRVKKKLSAKLLNNRTIDCHEY